MELYSNLKRVFVGVFCIVLFYSIVLWLSVLLYGLIYYWFIPAAAHIRPVYLQFPPSDCANQCHSKSICPFPYGNVTLVNEGEYELLSGGHTYTVEIALDMPESIANQKLGMFMVQMEMQSQSRSVLQYSSRPAILSYKSYLFEAIYTLFHTPYLLAGSLEEKQLIVIPLFEHYQEDSFDPTYSAYIKVLSRSIQIYSCYLRIHAQFRGIRYFMYYWPIFSAFVGVSTFFITLCLIVLVILFQWMKTSQLMNLPEQINTRLQGQKQSKLNKEERNRIKALLRSGEISSSGDIVDSSDDPSEEGSAVPAQSSEDVKEPSSTAVGKSKKLKKSDDESEGEVPDISKKIKKEKPQLHVPSYDDADLSREDFSVEEILLDYEQYPPEESELLKSIRQRRI